MSQPNLHNTIRELTSTIRNARKSAERKYFYDPNRDLSLTIQDELISPLESFTKSLPEYLFYDEITDEIIEPTNWIQNITTNKNDKGIQIGLQVKMQHYLDVKIPFAPKLIEIDCTFYVDNSGNLEVNITRQIIQNDNCSQIDLAPNIFGINNYRAKYDSKYIDNLNNSNNSLPLNSSSTQKPTNGFYSDPMFYINGGIGAASIGATVKGGYHLSNELYHFTKPYSAKPYGNLHLRGGKYWKNPFVNNSKKVISARGGAWRSAGTKLGYVGIAITAGDAALSGEFKASQGINVAMTTLAIAVPGVGSIVAGVYFVADIGLLLSTGKGIGDRIDEATGGTHELYEGFY